MDFESSFEKGGTTLLMHTGAQSLFLKTVHASRKHFAQPILDSREASDLSSNDIEHFSLSCKFPAARTLSPKPSIFHTKSGYTKIADPMYVFRENVLCAPIKVCTTSLTQRKETLPTPVKLVSRAAVMQNVQLGDKPSANSLPGSSQQNRMQLKGEASRQAIDTQSIIAQNNRHLKPAFAPRSASATGEDRGSIRNTRRELSTPFRQKQASGENATVDQPLRRFSKACIDTTGNVVSASSCTVFIDTAHEHHPVVCSEPHETGKNHFCEVNPRAHSSVHSERAGNDVTLTTVTLGRGVEKAISPMLAGTAATKEYLDQYCYINGKASANTSDRGTACDYNIRSETLVPYISEGMNENRKSFNGQKARERFVECIAGDFQRGLELRDIVRNREYTRIASLHPDAMAHSVNAFIHSVTLRSRSPRHPRTPLVYSPESVQLNIGQELTCPIVEDVVNEQPASITKNSYRALPRELSPDNQILMKTTNNSALRRAEEDIFEQSPAHEQNDARQSCFPVYPLSPTRDSPGPKVARTSAQRSTNPTDMVGTEESYHIPTYCAAPFFSPASPRIDQPGIRISYSEPGVVLHNDNGYELRESHDLLGDRTRSNTAQPLVIDSYTIQAQQSSSLLAKLVTSDEPSMQDGSASRTELGLSSIDLRYAVQKSELYHDTIKCAAKERFYKMGSPALEPRIGVTSVDDASVRVSVSPICSDDGIRAFNVCIDSLSSPLLGKPTEQTLKDFTDYVSLRSAVSAISSTRTDRPSHSAFRPNTKAHAVSLHQNVSESQPRGGSPNRYGQQRSTNPSNSILDLHLLDATIHGAGNSAVELTTYGADRMHSGLVQVQDCDLVTQIEAAERNLHTCANDYDELTVDSLSEYDIRKLLKSATPEQAKKIWGLMRLSNERTKKLLGRRAFASSIAELSPTDTKIDRILVSVPDIGLCPRLSKTSPGRPRQKLLSARMADPRVVRPGASTAGMTRTMRDPHGELRHEMEYYEDILLEYDALLVYRRYMNRGIAYPDVYKSLSKMNDKARRALIYGIRAQNI